MHEKLSELARAILIKEGKAPVQSMMTIDNLGLVNTIIKVETQLETYILRLNFEDGLEPFKKEQWCMSKVHQIGVPSPIVYSIGMMGDTVYMLMDYIEGSNVSRLEGDKAMIWESVGAYARKFHQVDVHGFGEDLVAQNGTFKDSWQRFVCYNIGELDDDDRLRRMAILTKSSSTTLRERLEALLRREWNFGLCHSDLSENNYILGNRQITYLLDWGSARADVVPHFDLGAIVYHSLPEESSEFAAFLKGYGLDQKTFGEMRADIETLWTLRTLDKVRWAMDRAPARLDLYLTELNQLLLKLLIS